MSRRSTTISLCRQYLLSELHKNRAACESAESEADLAAAFWKQEELRLLHEWLQSQGGRGSPSESGTGQLTTALRDRGGNPMPRAAVPSAPTPKGVAITGYAARFYDPADSLGTQYDMGDGLVERIMPGAFDRVFSGRSNDIKAAWGHDLNVCLGSRAAGTLELGTDSRGLWFRIHPSSAAGFFVEAVQRGDVAQASFAFQIESDGGARFRPELGGVVAAEIIQVSRLWEVSPVAFGAYSGTSSRVESRAARRSTAPRWTPNHTAF
jgi:HK97 family phage prohead protease